MRIIQSAFRTLSEDGIIAVFIKTAKYINRNICGVSKVFIFELDLENPIQNNPPEIELSFRTASEDDLDSMDNEKYGYDTKGKQYSKDQLAKGDRCYLAIHNEKIIGYTWVMKDYMEISQFKHIPLPKHRSYGFNSFVLKEYRGKRVAGAMYQHKNDILRSEGIRYAVTVINPVNLPPIKSTGRMGYKKIGHITIFIFFGFKYYYLNNKSRSYLQKA